MAKIVHVALAFITLLAVCVLGGLIIADPSSSRELAATFGGAVFLFIYSIWIASMMTIADIVEEKIRQFNRG